VHPKSDENAYPRSPLLSGQREFYAVSDSKAVCAVHAPYDMCRPTGRERPLRTVNLTFACRWRSFTLHNPAERHLRAPGAILIPCADATNYNSRHVHVLKEGGSVLFLATVDRASRLA